MDGKKKNTPQALGPKKNQRKGIKKANAGSIGKSGKKRALKWGPASEADGKFCQRPNWTSNNKNARD